MEEWQAVRLGYLDEPSVRPAFDLLTEISKMLRELRARLQNSAAPA